MGHTGAQKLIPWLVAHQGKLSAHHSGQQQSNAIPCMIPAEAIKAIGVLPAMRHDDAGHS